MIARKRLPEAIRLNLLFCQVSNSQNIHYGGQGDVKVMIPKQGSVLIETRSIKLERLQEDFWEKSQNYGFVPGSQILSSLLDFQSSTYIYHLCFSQPTFWSKHAFCHLSRGSCAQNLSFSICQYRQVVFSYSMLQAAFGQAKIRGVAGAKLQRSYLLVKGQNRQCW